MTATTKLTILSTSDTHGYVLPTNYVIRAGVQPFGLTRAATVINTVRQEDPEHTLVVENGDFLQGSPLAYYAVRGTAQPDPTLLTQAYNALGYDVGTLGNHEFNYGSAYLRQVLATLTYPLAQANILAADGQPAFAPPYQLIKKGELTVAVLGLTTSFIPHWEGPDHIAGLQFADVLATAKTWVPRLRKLADVVVVIYHGGFERDLASGAPTERLTGENVGYALSAIPGIDALVTGHQHRQLAGHVHGVPITQPGYRGEAVGQITLTVAHSGNQWQVQASSARLLPTGEAAPDPQMTTLMAPVQATVEDWLDSPLGRVQGDMRITDPDAARITESPYIEFIQKVQMAATGTDISGTALFNNEGTGFGSTVSLRDVMTNYIYPNTLAVLRVTGSVLKAALEKSARYFQPGPHGTIAVNPRFLTPKPQRYNYDMYHGITYTIDVAQPMGERITQLDYHGAPVRPDQVLEITVNQYRAGGGGNYTMFSADSIVRENQKDMTELIADYLKAHPVITATADHNFHVINSSAT
ncbi:bifunctional metallophosphatase/5'-nucleotidase [Schleiferilactobacillus shenzhenensis]|uniref:2',3'-cyclic-nucleotide 2'-phosphodiesterase n=1 Tax=Schleiferilactobacillus shenzhenensis LY-73 TaxID=1231336 RepID=U4TQQ1_9LACO|nr:bifunctional UDP-sugar hydrolase/5'-nucleotidase [Schleiferilactobacillus shenzhenensis]ERL66549.1 2',3'-cyclic-nucleotide 2'-phosphodiesterase [Schleiferilactobacillus shenzhenensis LY-73]